MQFLSYGGNIVSLVKGGKMCVQGKSHTENTYTACRQSSGVWSGVCNNHWDLKG